MNRLRARPSSRRTLAGRRIVAAARVVASLVGFAALLAGGPARATLLATLVTEVGGVGILAPDTSDPIIAEAVARLRAELHLAGLENQLIECDAAPDARACSADRTDPPEGDAVTPAARSARAGVERAIIVLAREDGVVTIEVIERLLNGSKFFRLVYVPARDGGDDPAVLAVRAVELLRDLHMDVERNRGAAPAAPAAPPVVAKQPGPPPATPGPWRISALAGLLQGRDGLGPRVGPVLGVSRAFGRRWAVGLLASGPYFQDLGAAATTDHTTSRQELAVLGVRGELPIGRARPFAVLSGGALHLVAQGYSDDPTALTHGRSLWSALLGAGVGAAFAVSEFIDVVAEADVLAAIPAGRIEIRSEVVATAGAPSGLFQLGLSVALP